MKSTIDARLTNPIRLTSEPPTQPQRSSAVFEGWQSTGVPRYNKLSGCSPFREQ
jgi:hypothetical protein